MSCAALALVAALTATAQPAPLTTEPLFADIVAKAEALETRARSLKTAPGGEQALMSEIAALAALDMQGHVTLKARGSDGDLKCILKGISEDLPKKVAALAVSDPALRAMAVDELVALLDDNVAVVTQPPGPATPPPAE